MKLSFFDGAMRERVFKNNRQIPILISVAVLLVSVACVMPEAVQQFTAVATDASQQFPPLVRDLTASCIRKQLADRPVEEITDARSEARKSCKEFSDLEASLLGALDVLINYLNALNQLASNEVVSYDNQIDGFAEKVQAAGKFGDGPVTAIKGLAKFLFDAAASGYQRKKLGSAIKAADADVATLTTALSTIVGDDYLRVLAVEEQSVIERFRQTIQADKNKNPTTHLLLQDRWRENLELFENKRHAARDCQQILAKIRDGHHQLAAQVDRWTAKELYQTLRPYTASIQQLVQDFQAAF
jgi:hypothetical protein